jgi:ABC-2 type transport system ATP-binding protein
MASEKATVHKDAISVTNLSKQIRGRVILEDINFRIPVGSIARIIGHNGAGKSMLLRVISGLVFPTSGEVKIFNEILGKDIEFPRNIGVLIEEPGLLSLYSGYDNLLLLSKIRNLINKDSIKDTIKSVGLDPDDKRPIKSYSTGMRQRLGIAIAIMENPDLVLLDEPSSGLDPEGIEIIHQLLHKLNKKRITILLTSHSLEEINLLTNLAFEMKSGKLFPSHQ